jgi:hypothetical protein
MTPVKTGEDRICKTCGAAFYVPRSRLNVSSASGSYCSMGCRTGAGGWRPGAGKDQFTASDADIVSAYQNGQCLREIGERYGVTLQAIAYRLRRAGVDRRKGQRGALSPEARKRASDAAKSRTGDKHPGYRADILDADLIAAYQSGASSQVIGEAFGISAATVLQRLKKAGIGLRHAGYSRPNDGHTVSSHWERAVDDWLFEHALPHSIHPRAPWSPQKSRCSYADFLVHGIYIEVWGLSGQAAYDARRLEKLAKYRMCGAQLIEVFPHHIIDGDFSPLERLLG